MKGAPPDTSRRASSRRAGDLTDRRILLFSLISTLVSTVDFFAVQRIKFTNLISCLRLRLGQGGYRRSWCTQLQFSGRAKGVASQAFFLGGLRGGRCSFLCLKGGGILAWGVGALGMGGGVREESKYRYCTLIGWSPRVCMHCGQLPAKGCFIALFLPVFLLLGFSRNIT